MKKLAQKDFSDNILIEFSPESLQNYHERAVQELKDFRHFFHWDHSLQDGLVIEGGNQQQHIVFKELCYLNQITPEQVLEYEFLLEKRIYDIEDMIDHHFNLIRDFLR